MKSTLTEDDVAELIRSVCHPNVKNLMDLSYNYDENIELPIDTIRHLTEGDWFYIVSTLKKYEFRLYRFEICNIKVYNRLKLYDYIKRYIREDFFDHYRLLWET